MPALNSLSDMSPMTIRSMPWDTFTTGLQGVFVIGTKTVTDYLGQAFHTSRTSLLQERRMSMAGLHTFPIREGMEGAPDLQPIVFRYEYDINQMSWYAGVQVSKGLMAATQHRGAIMESIQSLGTQAKVTEQIYAMSYFAQTANLEDGVPFFAPNHPLIPAGMTFPNIVHGGLSVNSLQRALTLMKMTPDEYGTAPMDIKPKAWWCHPAMRFQLDEALSKSSSYRPLEMTHTENVIGIQYPLPVIECPYWPDPNLVALQGDQYYTVAPTFEPLNMDQVLDRILRATVYTGAFSMQRAALGWRGWVGITL